MASTNFNNLPVYLTKPNTAGSPALNEDSSRKAFAQQVQFNYTPSLSTTRLLGASARRKNVVMTGPPNLSISFSCLLQSSGYSNETARRDVQEFNPFDYTGEQGAGCGITIGHESNGITLTGCFLTSLSLSISPYAPVVANCDFACYDVPNITTAVLGNGGKLTALADASNHASPRDFDVTGLVHGIYSTFTGYVDHALDFESVGYNYSASYTPVYKMGEFTPDVHFTTAEQSLQVQADNTAGLSPVTGLAVRPSIELRSSSDPFKKIIFDGVLNGENVSITAGDLARAQLNITEPLK